MPQRPSRTRPAVAAGTALVLALAATGCGSGDDDADTTSTGAGGATTTTATTGGGSTTTDAGSGGGAPTGGAPAANEGAIRAALARGPESSKAAKTARITLETSTAGITTKATGTLDLVDQRYAFTQTLGGGSGGGSTEFQNYGEKGKVYIKIPGAGGWSVTDNPIQTSDPLAQVKQLEKATITDVGGTKEYGGKTCRQFSAELALGDVLGQIDDPSFKQFLDQAPKGAKVPVTTCIDDGGLAYSSTSSYDLKEVLGSAAAQLPSGRSSSKLEVTDYGTAPAPARPSGIDDAKPLGSGTTSPSAG